MEQSCCEVTVERNFARMSEMLAVELPESRYELDV